MLRPARHSRILALTRSQGAVRIGELSRRLGVSAPTIRRDLASLAGQGLVARVRGGALEVGTAGGVAGPPALAEAAALVRPGTAVGISAGTAAIAVARQLLAVAGLTVVTPSPACAQVFAGSAAHTVVIVGGV